VRIRKGRAVDGQVSEIRNRAQLEWDLTVEAQINTIDVLPETVRYDQYEEEGHLCVTTYAAR
jgi:hypothetical protein